MKPVELAAAVLVLGLGGGCGGGCNVPPTPQSETCELAPGAPRPTVTMVEIGHLSNGVFAPIVADSIVELVVGGQGSDMVVATLRITGAGLSSCTAQSTFLEEADGDPITSETAPMATTPAGPGTFLTGNILLPYYGSYGALVRIRADVSGTTSMVEFWAGDRYDIDAAPDARTDARPVDAAADAVVPDALPADAPPDA